MGSPYKPVSKTRWPGVYSYESSKRTFRGKPDVCYRIRYKVDGKEKAEKVGWKSEGYTPQVAADIRGDRMKKARHGDEVLTQSEIRAKKQKKLRALDDIAEAYFDSQGQNMRPDVERIDRGRYYNHVSPVVGSRAVSSLAPMDMQRITKNMGDLSKTSKWAALEILRRVTRFGAKNNLCPPLAFQIEMPKKDNEVVEYLTGEEMERLQKVLEEWPSKDIVGMLRLAMYTGMRRGEIFKLEDRDLDFRQQLIRIRDPKGGKSASIPMSGLVADLLRDQLDLRDSMYPDSPYVFPTTGGGLRKGSHAVGRIKAKADLPDSFRIFQGLRHHFAITLANSGEVTLDMIGELLTHKSYQMTKRYAQFLPERKKEISELASILIQSQKSKKEQDDAETSVNG